MNQMQIYHSYLNSFSSIVDAYRKYFLYPKINSVIHGNILDVGCELGHYLTF